MLRILGRIYELWWCWKDRYVDAKCPDDDDVEGDNTPPAERRGGY